jgi:hypothetical protein
VSAINYISFLDFHNQLLPLVAPEDLAEEMVELFRDQVGNALADIQTLIPWFRNFNVERIQKGGAHGLVEFCNASVFEGPPGKITQLFAYRPSLDCRRYFYQRASTAAVDCWMERQRCLCPATTPPANEIYDSPYCNYVIDGDVSCSSPYLTGEEDDCKFKSLLPSDRIYAVGPDYKIYAAPRFPCGYMLLMQWQGIRRSWSDSDLVPVDQQLREAVVNYVEHKLALKERNSAAMNEYFQAYTINLRMLSYRYQDEMDTSPARDCSAGIAQLLSEMQPLYTTP